MLYLHFEYVCVHVNEGGDEVSAAHSAAVVEPDADCKQSGAGAADTRRAAPGQSLSVCRFMDVTKL